MRLNTRILFAFVILFLAPWRGPLRAQDEVNNACHRLAAGSVVAEPADLRSRAGVLKVDLTIHKFGYSDGSTRYCYVDAQGNVSPTLRLHPGDLLILNLKNEMGEAEHAPAVAKRIHAQMHDPDMNGKKMTDE